MYNNRAYFLRETIQDKTRKNIITVIASTVDSWKLWNRCVNLKFVKIDSLKRMLYGMYQWILSLAANNGSKDQSALDNCMCSSCQYTIIKLCVILVNLFFGCATKCMHCIMQPHQLQVCILCASFYTSSISIMLKAWFWCFQNVESLLKKVIMYSLPDVFQLICQLSIIKAKISSEVNHLPCIASLMKSSFGHTVVVS